MKFKTFFCIIEVEILLLIVVFTSIMSNTVYSFLKYFFLCYLFIIFHELSHVFISNLLGRKLVKIKLSLCGMCAIYEKYTKSKSDIFIYLAGPVSNIILALIFRNNNIIFSINLFLCVLNLVPIYPLDGFNILNVILSKKYIKILEYVFFVIFCSISFLMIFMQNNYSFVVFMMYLIVLKISSNITNLHKY